MDYLYDESFEGFLNCVYLHYYEEKASGIFPAARYQGNLISPHKIVENDAERAARVYAAIERKMSSHDLRRVYLAFCAAVPDKEMKLLRYIRLGFRHGSKIRLLHGNAVVFDVQQAERKVVSEVHRLCGLIRFSEVRPAGAASGGFAAPASAPPGAPVSSGLPGRPGAGAAKNILYAPIDPDHDVVEFLAPHFCDRFKQEAFIIHDRKRSKALVSAAGEWYITDFRDAGALAQTGAEVAYRKLWKEYFGAVAIKERTNPACQRRFMPARYWKNLTEFS